MRNTNYTNNNYHYYHTTNNNNNNNNYNAPIAAPLGDVRRDDLAHQADAAHTFYDLL